MAAVVVATMTYGCCMAVLLIGMGALEALFNGVIRSPSSVSWKAQPRRRHRSALFRLAARQRARNENSWHVRCDDRTDARVLADSPERRPSIGSRIGSRIRPRPRPPPTRNGARSRRRSPAIARRGLCPHDTRSFALGLSMEWSLTPLLGKTGLQVARASGRRVLCCRSRGAASPRSPITGDHSTRRTIWHDLLWHRCSGATSTCSGMWSS